MTKYFSCKLDMPSGRVENMFFTERMVNTVMFAVYDGSKFVGGNSSRLCGTLQLF